jgi:hypothetical protein
VLGHQFMVDQITEGMAAYIPNGEHQIVRLFVTPRATQFTRTAQFVVATENRLIVCRAQTSVVPVAGELVFTALLADVTISVEYRALWDRLELSCADSTRVQGFARIEWRPEVERLVVHLTQARLAPPAFAPPLAASVTPVAVPSRSRRRGGPATWSLALAAMFLAIGLFGLVGKVFDPGENLEPIIYALVMSAIFAAIGLYQRRYLRAHPPRQRAQ